MAKVTRLDTQWQQLMALCENEAKFRREGRQRLLKLVVSDIEELASQMGFSPRRIASRDFRALREGGRIVSISTD